MRTVLIIGASRGIGLEFARQHLQAGDRVLATVRSDAARDQLRALGAEVFKVDVTDPASISGLAWQLDGEKLALAIYVAGVIDRADATTPPTHEQFDAVMHANVLGAMQAMPQVLPMVQAADGVFAVVSSGMGLIGTVSGSNAWLYRVSKAALNMALASARHSYSQATLVALSPGWVQTDMGGAGADLTVPESVRHMRQVLANVTAADNGRFIHHDGRRAEQW